MKRSRLACIYCYLIIINCLMIRGLKITMDLTRSSMQCTDILAEYNEATNVTFQSTIVAREPDMPSTQGGHRQFVINHSSDTFMGLKCNIINNISQLNESFSTDANVRIDIALWTSLPGCAKMMGIGGSPSESIFIKAGIFTDEPLSRPFQSNEVALTDTDPKIEENAPVLEVQKTGKKWDIIRKGMEWQQRLINLSALGNQATEGPDMWTLGTLTDDAYCDSKNDTELRMLKLTTMMNFTLAQDASSLWILIGADAGYEGSIEIIWSRLTITFGRDALAVMSHDPGHVFEEQNIDSTSTDTPQYVKIILGFAIACACGAALFAIYRGITYWVYYRRNKRLGQLGMPEYRRAPLIYRQRNSFEDFEQLAMKDTSATNLYRLEDFLDDDRYE